MKNSRRRVLLMTANKFGSSYMHTLCRADEVDHIFSDALVPEGIILESERNAASLFGTAKTLYSAGGSTQSIHAMLFSAYINAPKGERPFVIAGRNAHKAFIYAAAKLDFDVKWIYPESAESICSCIITPEMLKKATDEFLGGSFNEMSRTYFKNLADFIVRTKVDVVGHIDLITKFNLEKPLFDETDCLYRKYALEAVDRILEIKPDILFEVNTGAMYRVGKKDPYPAEFILRYIREKGGRITLTSDSHNTESLDFAFEEATSVIKKCGFKKIHYLTSDGIKIYEV